MNIKKKGEPEVKKSILFVFALLIFGTLLSQIVMAQDGVANTLSDWLSRDSLKNLYENHYVIIDAIIYILIFTMVARASLGNQKIFGEENGKNLGLVIGFALGISAAVFEANSPSEFNLASLGSFAVGFAVFLLGFIMYKFIHGMGMSSHKSAIIGGVFSFGIAATVGRQIVQETYPDNDLAVAIVDIATIGFFVTLCATAWFLIAKSPALLTGISGGKKSGDSKDIPEHQDSHESEHEKREVQLKDERRDIENTQQVVEQSENDGLEIQERISKLEREILNLASLIGTGMSKLERLEEELKREINSNGQIERMGSDEKSSADGEASQRRLF